MTLTTVQAGFDTWAESTHPSKNHNDDKSLRVLSGAERSFIHAAIPAPPGSTVQSAYFTIYAKGDSTGSRTVTLYLVTDPWKARGLDWNNQPAVSSTVTVPVAVGTLHDKDPITFDVKSIVQSMVNGDIPNYGWRISTTSSTEHKFYSAQSGVKNPVLVVNYVENPAIPTNLRPAGGLVGVSAPTLQWTYTGTSDMSLYQVQVDPNANGVTPAYDSGAQSSSQAVHALAGTSYAGLADGATTYWRVKVTDTAGLSSLDWSDWVAMTRDNKGTLTLNNPAATPNNYVTEPTPPILFALTGETLAAYRILITDQADHNHVLLDSGKISGTIGAYTVPSDDKVRARHKTVQRPILVSGGSYSICVRAWDTKRRQGSLATGDESYAEIWRDFTMHHTGSITAPSITAVTQNGVTPAAKVAFTRGTAPDEFIILRDGVEITTGIASSDLVVTGTAYAFYDWTAKPRVAHSYQVKSVVNGVQGNPSTAAALATGTQVGDVWVIDPDTGRYFALWGNDLSSWQQVDIGSDYLPIDGRIGFRITQALGGLTGPYAGELRDQEAGTVAQMESDLWLMKADAPHADGFRLVAANINIPVRISNLTCAPSGEELPGQPVRSVAFTFSQTGELEFSGNV